MDRWTWLVMLALVGASACGDDESQNNAHSASTRSGAPLDAGARVIEIAPPDFFPEGVALDRDGKFYIGSMELGSIHRATAVSAQTEPFIEPDDENGLVSVIGLYADDANRKLYVCSSDPGQGARAGTAPAAIKVFHADDGKFIQSFAWPQFSGAPLPEQDTRGVTGFCNDMTMDVEGNLYATDSWYPRILRLPAGGEALEEWLVSDVFPQDQWHLNGIDIDQASGILYVVENHPGALYAVPIEQDGSPGEARELATSRPLLGPDGLKVAAPGLLVVAEGSNDGGGVAWLRATSTRAEVVDVIKGFDQVATFALYQSSAWIVENQGDHFWSPDESGAFASPPFRLVEVPLELGAGAGVIEVGDAEFFPEGVALDEQGNFYIGSMNTGAIHKAAAGAEKTAPFIEPNDENGLVSALGLYVQGDTLWACSSDAGNGLRAGAAPAALKAFDLASGQLKGSWAWPPYARPLPESDTAGVAGFCNDIAIDAQGNVYATDSWYPRILRLRAGATESDALEEWVTSSVIPANQWHLNGIDVDRTRGIVYAVENHPGTLYAVAIQPDGTAGVLRPVATSRPLYGPDGLKVIGPDRLAVAEGQTGGMAVIQIGGATARVQRVSTGLDGIATFAVRDGSAWLVENQGDHFWGEASDRLKPFRLVEVPLNLP